MNGLFLYLISEQEKLMSTKYPFIISYTTPTNSVKTMLIMAESKSLAIDAYFAVNSDPLTVLNNIVKLENLAKDAGESLVIIDAKETAKIMCKTLGDGEPILDIDELENTDKPYPNELFDDQGWEFVLMESLAHTPLDTTIENEV